MLRKPQTPHAVAIPPRAGPSAVAAAAMRSGAGIRFREATAVDDADEDAVTAAAATRGGFRGWTMRNSQGPESAGAGARPSADVGASSRSVVSGRPRISQMDATHGEERRRERRRRKRHDTR